MKTLHAFVVVMYLTFLFVCSSDSIVGTTDETELTATAISPDSIALVWTGISDAKIYHIYRSEKDTDNFILIDSTTNLNYKDKELKSSTLYYYYVVVIDAKYSQIQKSNIDSAITFAVSFGKRFQFYNSLRSLVNTRDGGYFATGLTVDFVGLDGYLLGWQVLFSQTGAIIKEQSYKGSGYASFHGLCKSSGGFLICGSTYTDDSSFDTGLLIKLSDSGDEQWSKQFSDTSGMVFWDAYELTDGSFIICGVRYTDFSFTHGYGIVTKVDRNGDTVWTRYHSTDSGLRMYQTIVSASNGTFFITGVLRTQNAFSGILVTVDDNGNETAFQSFHECRFYSSTRIVSSGREQFLAGGKDSTGAVIKLFDADLNLVWSKSLLADNPGSITRSVITTDDNHFAMCGGMTVSPKRGWYCKYSINEELEWIHIKENTDFTDIIQTNDGGFALCGEYPGEDAYHSDGCLIKTDSYGKVGNE
ncbi:MAG: hypothetical protein JW915_02510 [Chitinispirillaceae bacterium]|nr:hypothetical protein [Chitinispirillaceae bacterium]